MRVNIGFGNDGASDIWDLYESKLSESHQLIKFRVIDTRIMVDQLAEVIIFDKREMTSARGPLFIGDGKQANKHTMDNTASIERSTKPIGDSRVTLEPIKGVSSSPKGHYIFRIDHIDGRHHEIKTPRSQTTLQRFGVGKYSPYRYHRHRRGRA